MNEMINAIGERMTRKMRVVNHIIKNKKQGQNLREIPWYSEFAGMKQLLRTMGIEYDIEYDETVTLMTAIIIMGKRFEVKEHTSAE